MRKLLCPLVLATAVVSLALVDSAGAVAVLSDASQPSYDAFQQLTPGVSYGQSFTAGWDGELWSLKLWGRSALAGADYSTGQLSVRVHAFEADGTLAESPVAHTLNKFVVATAAGSWMYIPLDVTYQQHEGEELAILITASGSQDWIQLAQQTGNPYADGAAFTLDSTDPFGDPIQSTTNDLAFTTATLFPEPASLAMVAVPALLLLRRRNPAIR